MTLSGFFSSTTATCTTTAVVAIVCCPLVLSIRAHREARRSAGLKRESVSVTEAFSTAAKPSPWMVVSRNPTPFPATHPSAMPQLQHEQTPVLTSDNVSEEATESPVDEQAEETLCDEPSLAELQPPSTLLVDIETTEVPASEAPVEDSLDIIAFLPPQSVLQHPEGSKRSTQDDDVIEQPAVDPLTLVPTTSPTIWQNPNDQLTIIAQRGEKEIERAFTLADKGAVFSARKQLEGVLQAIAHGLDARHGIQAHSDCLACGLLALHEARDFLPVLGNARARHSVAEIAAKHRSQILTKDDCKEFEPAEAMRRYDEYALDHLAAATGGSPVASQAFYGLGKLAMSQATRDNAAQRTHNLNALAFFQVALKAYEANYLAANELGVLLAREGQLEEARTVLQKSIAVQPMAEAWHNLTVVHERLGEHERSALARLEWQRIASATASGQPAVIRAANGSAVHWVDKATFERGSLPVGPVFGAHPAGGALR